MINITFLILCVIRAFIQIPFPYYEKSRILVHAALNFRNTEKSMSDERSNFFYEHLKLDR